MKEDFALNQHQNKIDSVFTKIDRKSTEIMSVLAQAPVFKKQGTVKARLAVLGEQISTVMSNGKLETINQASADDWVITNPSGEDYLIAASMFFSRYEETFKDGIYSAKGYCRVIKNPYGAPIEIMASWGELQFGDENCYIADTCDADGGDMGGEPYIIEVSAFAQTYAPTHNVELTS